MQFFNNVKIFQFEQKISAVKGISLVVLTTRSQTEIHAKNQIFNNAMLL